MNGEGRGNALLDEEEVGVDQDEVSDVERVGRELHREGRARKRGQSSVASLREGRVRAQGEAGRRTHDEDERLEQRLCRV